jgi:hypothetical protein
MPTTILTWHFCAEAGKLRDGSPFEVSTPLPTITGTVEPCERGYHGSPSVFDAVQYAPGPHLYARELSGIVKPHGAPVDKYASSDATAILYAGDVSRLLRVFACQCAADVLYLWKPPQVVKDYLLTQDESLRAAAWAAAGAAARDAARAAARAAWAAAWAAAREARDAAWAAQRKRLESWVVRYIKSGVIPTVVIPENQEVRACR